MTSTERSERKVIVLAPDAGHSFSVRPGDRMTLKVVGRDTGGAFALAEFDAPPGYTGPPPHRHQETDEAFYVLQGEFRLQVEGETVRAGPGTFVFVPRGVRHTYANPGPDPARLLLFLSPAGFERYFLDLSAAVSAGGGTAPPDVLAAVFARHGVVVDSPPGAPSGAPAESQPDGTGRAEEGPPMTAERHSLDLSTAYPRSALETFAGVLMAPRTTDKCRAHLAGTLGEYIYNCGLDRQLFRFLGTDAEEFAAVVRQGGGDGPVEAFVRQKVAGKSPQEIAAWGSQFLDYEPDLARDAYSGQREALARRAPGRSDLTLWVHLTDIEEGRAVPTPEEVQAFRAQLARA